jgi:hypothetical protein
MSKMAERPSGVVTWNSKDATLEPKVGRQEEFKKIYRKLKKYIFYISSI